MKLVTQLHCGDSVEASFRRGPHLLVLVASVVALAACGRTYVAEEIPNTFEMPAGVPIHVDLVDPAQAEDIEVGQPFAGVLAEPLYYDREKLDPEGNVFEERTLVAPIGAPVAGVGVAAPQERAGLQLESVTFHGGMSFPVETSVVIPASASETSSAEGETSDQAEALTFNLTAPADVALVIDFRDKESEGQAN